MTNFEYYRTDPVKFAELIVSWNPDNNTYNGISSFGFPCEFPDRELAMLDTVDWLHKQH